MKWAKSLVKISNHEVEMLQQRLGEIVGRRIEVEQRILALDNEVQAETSRAGHLEEAGIYLGGYREGAKIRRGQFESELAEIASEEEGARDALAEAFQTLKKYEHVVDMAKAEADREEARRETAELDELGLRKAANH